MIVYCGTYVTSTFFVAWLKMYGATDGGDSGLIDIFQPRWQVFNIVTI